MNYTGSINNQYSHKPKGRIPRRPEVFRFGKFRFIPASAELFKGRTKVPLKVQSARVLGILLKNHGNLVTRDQIIREIWPDRTVEFDLSLNSCIRDIRHALEDNPKAPKFIETLSKRGYRFLEEVVIHPSRPFYVPTTSKVMNRALGAVLATTFLLVGVVGGQAFFSPGVQQGPVAVAEDARALMLEGVSALYDGPVAKTEEALGFFQQAVAIDPTFTEAQVMIARTVFARAEPGDSHMGFSALESILERDPYNVDALAMLGGMEWAFNHDFEAAKATYERLLQIDPSYGQAYVALAGYYSVMGDFDSSLTQVDQALNIDAIRLTHSGSAGWFYYLAGQYEEGVKFCRQTQEVSPDDLVTPRCFMNNFLAMGQKEEAANFALSYLDMKGVEPETLDRLQSAPKDEILNFLFAFEGQGDVATSRARPDQLYQAIALTRMGEVNKALDVLEAAYEARNFYAPYMMVVPDLQSLESEPRFQALKQAMAPAP